MGEKWNLGCGRNPIDGYINFDKYAQGDGIQYLDLEKLPLDLPSNTAEEILLISVLEHLFVNPTTFMYEMHRTMEVGGIIKMVLPYIGRPSIAHIKGYYSRKYFTSICGGKWRKREGDKITGGQSLPLFELQYVKLKRAKLITSFPFIKLANEYVLKKLECKDAKYMYPKLNVNALGEE